MSSQSLWPPDIAQGGVKTPAAILREQASMLGQLTNNLLEGQISGGNMRSVDGLVFDFDIIAPALDHYRYTLLSLTYRPTRMYPVEVWFVPDNTAHRANSEEELLAVLRNLLGSPETKHVIQSLLAQSTQ